MVKGNGWLAASPGCRAVFADEQGNHREGFVELVDLDLGVAWIREQTTGERQMVIRSAFPRAVVN